MRKISSLLFALLLVSTLLVPPARAQWPGAPPLPRWGDYDDTDTWRDAAWWWENRPEWVRAHHPDWWGDFHDQHHWRPA